jgi:prepilin signal peptidase PulO-like enzyme (type II secretory pathway)
MTFLHGIVSFGEIYILPIYFQSIKDASPLQSAIDIFPATAPGPIAAIAAGLIMAKTGKCRVQISFWWVITTVGCGLLYLLDLDTPKWQGALYQVITDLGVGALVTITLPPIQSSLPMEDMAYATAAYAFSRSFGSVWGIALGTNVFIGTVNGRLNAIEGLNEIGLNGATSLGFATELTKLPATLIQPVKVAFNHALKNSFLAFIPFAILAFLISLFIIDLPLPDFDRSEEGVHRLPIEDTEEVEKIEPWSALEKGTIRISYV